MNQSLDALFQLDECAVIGQRYHFSVDLDAERIALHDIGPWTADVYLLFCLGHGDAWPAGDLAVQEAVKIGLGLKTRPTAKQMAPLAEPWRPLRGAAAHLWWSYYRAIKKREGVIGKAN